MKRTLHTTILAGLAVPLLAAAAPAAVGDRLADYAVAAKQENPAFAGFSAERGRTLHERLFAGGKPETPACASCHGKDARGAGRTPAGKGIDAMALSVTPTRYADPVKLEKWFRRNCNEVIGRDCTAQEKGDWLSYMRSQ